MKTGSIPSWARKCPPSGSQSLGPAPEYVGLTHAAARRLDRYGNDLVFAGGGGRCSSFNDDVGRVHPIAVVYNAWDQRRPTARIVAAVRAAPGWGPGNSGRVTKPHTDRDAAANQPALDAAAADGARIAGRRYYSGAVVDDTANTVTIYLAHAPRSLVARLHAVHPGVYVVHDDSPRPWAAVTRLQRSLDWSAWKAQGIDIVSTGPTQTGYLQVGVTSGVAKAQAAFDARYGRGVVRVVKGELAVAW